MGGYQRINLECAAGEDLASAVHRGFASSPRSLPCRFLYDELGSRLFEAICATEAYYPTRCERAILAQRASELAGRFGGARLIELGSGNSEKTALLLDAWAPPKRYTAIDLDGSVLDRAGQRLVQADPSLTVSAIRADYHTGLTHALAGERGPALILFLGGNIGNFDRAAAAAFLGEIRMRLGPRDGVLVGIDLRKERGRLEEAYDDPVGVTAAFNRNLLARIRRELGGDLDPRGFRHRALYDSQDGVMRLYLESRHDQRAQVGRREYSFAAGERIHTEDAVKYDRGEIEALARGAGLELVEHWLDPEGLYSLNLLGPG